MTKRTVLKLAGAGAGALAAPAVLAAGVGWLAKAAAQQAPASPVVTYFDRGKVDAGFTHNATLLTGESGAANYKVLTAHRDGPGEVEIHTLDTDIIYVVDGTATFVTGGIPEGAKSTAPDELRGQSIQGGETRELGKGDVIIIPHGVPHWFKAVKPPFLYFVVKVR